MEIGSLLQIFAQYKYQAIFPIAVMEGPIISIISGFLVSLGHLSFFPALLVVFLGDFISDFVLYLIGRGGREGMRYVRFLHIHEEKLDTLEKQYATHPWKTMIVAKASYGLGIGFMLASGLAKISWQKFIGYAGVLNLFRSTILMGIGFYFGKTALRFAPTYLEYYTIGVIIALPILFIIFRKKYLQKD